MTRTKTFSLLLAAAAISLVALVVAGCGGGDDQATAASANPSGSTLAVSDAGDLGKILVDPQGRTVYLFEKETGPMSACSGACAQEWPPVTTSGKPTAGGDLDESMLGTTKRSDGTTQVTYNRHPLYRFYADNAPGDTAGQGVDAFGAKWYVLDPAGNRVTGSSGGSNGGSYPY